jgi:hypothetical protein
LGVTEQERIDAAVRRVLSPLPVTRARAEWVSDRVVLLVISLGLVAILLTIIVGLLLTPKALPNWAENVFVSVATASALKLGDCIAALVALSGGKTVERLGQSLANAPPSDPPATEPRP